MEIEERKGYYEVLDIYKSYADDDWYGTRKKGEYTNLLAKVKLVFTSTMKLRLLIDLFDTGLLRKVTEERRQTIQSYWADHPADYVKYQEYTVGNSIGYWSMELSIRPGEFELWKQAVSFLPRKFNMQQFYGWFNNNFWTIKKISEEEKMKGKKYQYYITFDLVEERLVVGKAPLYTNARIVFGK